MSDFMLDEYEEYLERFEAWGQEYFDRPMDFDEFEAAMVDIDHYSVLEEIGELKSKEKRRWEELERRMLTHECYFEDGPRVTIIVDDGHQG